MEHLSEDERQARARLQELVGESRTSLAKLSRMIGRNAAYLQQYVARGSPRHLETGDLQRLAQFLGVPESTIATRRPVTDAGRSARSDSEGDWLEVPRLPLDASAGPGAFGVEEISYDKIRFSRRWVREMGLEGAVLSAIRVEGDSMEPLLRAGDEIFVDRNKRSGEGVHVVRVGDALHVKQVQVTAPGRIKLVSANEAYTPLELDVGEVEIIGRVVWKGGRV